MKTRQEQAILTIILFNEKAIWAGVTAQQSHHTGTVSPIVPANHWIRKVNDLLSPAALLTLQPSSFKKVEVSGPNVPDVCTATGWKQ